MGNVLITGALGNVGGYVAQNALSLGLDVTVADVDEGRLSARYGDRATTVRLDFTDPSTFSTALRQVDRVFVMRPPHLGSPKDLKPFIEALKDTPGIRLVCFLSLLGVEKNPVPPHHRIEKYLNQTGLPCCHIRPSFFMQNLSGVHADEIRHFNCIAVPVGQAKTSFIDAEDIGEFVATLFTKSEPHAGKAYALTGPEALDYHQVATVMTEELGRHIRYAALSPATATAYWRQIRGIDRKYATVMGLLYMMTHLGSAKRVTGTFASIMGRSPGDFRAFVRKNRQAWE